MFLLLYSLSVDCFGMNTTAEYDTQREIIKFSAMPSQTLIGENKNLCQTVINTQEYIIYLEVGSSIFESTTLQYNATKQISVELACRTGSQCDLNTIKDVTAVRYVLYFMNLDFNITSIVNQYDIINYDHTDCIRDVEMVYDTINTEVNAQFTGRPKHCPNNGTGSNILLREYVNGELKVEAPLPLKAYPIVFPNSGITLITPITQFWEKVTKLGPLTTTFIKNLKDMIDEGLQNFFNQILVELAVNTNVTQKDSTGANIIIPFNQSISFYILRKRNQVQDDCFTNVKLIIQRQSITISAQSNPSASKCNQQYIHDQGFPYDNIKFLLVAAQNEDYSGFVYDGLYEVPGYKLGDSVKYTITCKTDKECASFSRILELQQQNGNISLILEHSYMQGTTFSLRSQYHPEITEALYQEIDINLRQLSICVDFVPLESKIYDIQIKILQFNIDISIYAQPGQRKYCQYLTEPQILLMKVLMRVMKQRITQGQSVLVSVDGQEVSLVTTTIYTVPDENENLLYLGCVLSFIVVALFIGSIFFDFSMEKPTVLLKPQST